jgi:chemotaxis protein CheC
MSNREITSFDIDILGEIGNIGSGNAATALSEILNKKVMLNVPMVNVCGINEIANVLGGAEEIRTGVFFGLSEALNGYVVFMIKESDALKIKNIAAGGYDIDTNSVVSEIANIISGAYVGSLAAMINDKIDITPPEVCQDMLGSLIDGLVACVLSVADKTVVIGTNLTIDDEEISGFYVLLLEEESLDKMLNYFNSISKM